MKNFYRKFQIISKFPLWPNYLRWVYREAVHDAIKLNVQNPQESQNFTCLLCGVSGEITARELIGFVLKSNSRAKIIIIDLGQDQVDSVKQLVKKEFPKANIKIRQANALNLDFIKVNSIDWIDIDGFF